MNLFSYFLYQQKRGKSLQNLRADNIKLNVHVCMYDYMCVTPTTPLGVGLTAFAVDLNRLNIS